MSVRDPLSASPPRRRCLGVAESAVASEVPAGPPVHAVRGPSRSAAALEMEITRYRSSEWLPRPGACAVPAHLAQQPLAAQLAGAAPGSTHRPARTETSPKPAPTSSAAGRTPTARPPHTQRASPRRRIRAAAPPARGGQEGSRCEAILSRFRNAASLAQLRYPPPGAHPFCVAACAALCVAARPWRSQGASQMSDNGRGGGGTGRWDGKNCDYGCGPAVRCRRAWARARG